VSPLTLHEGLPARGPYGFVTRLLNTETNFYLIITDVIAAKIGTHFTLSKTSLKFRHQKIGDTNRKVIVRESLGSILNIK
jgi:hypothetical protein